MLIFTVHHVLANEKCHKDCYLGVEMQKRLKNSSLEKNGFELILYFLICIRMSVK